MVHVCYFVGKSHCNDADRAALCLSCSLWREVYSSTQVLYTCMLLLSGFHHHILVCSSTVMTASHTYQITSVIHCISSIRCCSYYFFAARFCAATIWGRCLFFFEKLVRRWWLLDPVCSSLSVLLAAMKITGTIQIALALVSWPFSEIICTHAHVLVAVTISFIQSFWLCGMPQITKDQILWEFK